MNIENLNIWCWIVPSLVGILSGILGFLVGKSTSKTIDNSTELNLCLEKNAQLEADLVTAKKKTIPLTATSKSSAEVSDITFDPAVAKAALGKTVKQDDLKIVEGIGPKIESMFKDAGIKTWKALSNVSVSDCQKVLDGGGNRYKIHDPASWPMQAKMCYEGKWKSLAKWQKAHKGGKL